MGKRNRQRARERPAAPTTTYGEADGGPGELELRGVLTPATRRAYADVLAGADRPAATRDDAEARALELLFERLAVRWTVSGVPTTGQRELLLRFRVATPAERTWVRATLREHAAEWFPDVTVP